MKTLQSLDGMVKAEVVPFYVQLILAYPGHEGDAEVKRLNQLIIDKWSNRALIEIKDQAWAAAKYLKPMFINYAERGFICGRSRQPLNVLLNDLFKP